MGTLFKTLFTLLILTPIVLLVVVWFALADRPLITDRTKLTPEDITRAKNIIKNNDPRQHPAGSRHTIRFTDKDLNLAGNYLLRQTAPGKLRVRTRAHTLNLAGTMRFRKLPRQFVNFVVQIKERRGQPELARVRVGSVNIPSPLAMWLLEYAIEEKKLQQEYALLKKTIERVEIDKDSVALTYQWDPSIVKKAQATILTHSTDQEALHSYHRELVRITRGGRLNRVSIVEAMVPMFRLAQARSQFSDPAEENKAMLSILAMWAGRGDLTTLVPNARQQPSSYRLTLRNRRDFGRHFLISAALAARSGNDISDAIGLEKELADAQTQSGFSFTDIAADRAGTRFGHFATESHDSAKRLQNTVANGLVESDFMPDISDMPEGLSANQFAIQYGGIGSPAYQRLIDDIDNRVSNSKIYYQ